MLLYWEPAYKKQKKISTVSHNSYMDYTFNSETCFLRRETTSTIKMATLNNKFEKLQRRDTTPRSNNNSNYYRSSNSDYRTILTLSKLVHNLSDTYIKHNNTKRTRQRFQLCTYTEKNHSRRNILCRWSCYKKLGNRCSRRNQIGCLECFTSQNYTEIWSTQGSNLRAKYTTKKPKYNHITCSQG